MKDSRALAALALFLLLAGNPAGLIGQSDLPEYGDLKELASMQKVFVFAEDTDSRKAIVSQLQRYKGVSIVNSPDDAEFILVYTVRSSTDRRGLQSANVERSNLTVYVIAASGRKRILWSEEETWEDRGGVSFGAPNEYNLTKHFIKALRKLRGEK